MIDLRRVHTLRVLRELGTVTAAASALHLTPSAVSQQLRQLANELGIELLRQDGRRVRLTPAAEILLEHGDAMAVIWEGCRADLAANAGGAIGEVRVVAFESLFRSVLLPTLHRLSESHPRLTVKLLEVDSAEATSRILTDRADIALLPVLGSPPTHDPRFDQALLVADPQDLLMAANHVLAHQDAVRLEDTSEHAWIAPHAEQKSLIEVACAAAGFSPRFIHEVNSWEVVQTLVEEGHGLCLAPRLMSVGEHRDIRRVPVAGQTAPERKVLTRIRKGGGQAPAVKIVLETLRAVAKGRALAL